LQISSFVITELETRQKKLLNIFQSYQWIIRHECYCFRNRQDDNWFM
jgi:hypothetical protein